MGEQKITMTITSTGGCTVTVEGVATWEGGVFSPPHNFRFKGKLTFSGTGANCSSGTLEFRSAARPEPGARAETRRAALALIEVSDPRQLRSIEWRTGDERATALLNDSSANQALCARLRAALDRERGAALPGRE